MTWIKPSSYTGDLPVDGYTIYRKMFTGNLIEIASVSNSTFSYLDSSLAFGFTYYYAIAAVNSAGESNLTDILDIYIPEKTVTETIKDTITDISTVTITTGNTTASNTTEDVGFGSFIFLGLVIVSIVVIRRKK
jgi:hypothetical protein